MDLGDIGVVLVAEGEAEARAAIERFVRARDAAVRSMEEGAQREVRAAEAIERAIQREIREYESLVRTAAGLERAYQDLVASFNPLNRAQLQYSRNIEMLDKALEANVINEQQRARALELMRQKMESTIETERTRELEAVAKASAEHTREILNAQDAYDRLVASMDPVVAAQQKYERGIDVLNQAEAKRVITVEERLAAEKRLEAQLAKDISSARTAQLRQENVEVDRSKQAHARLVGELERLKATVNPVIRQQQLYDQAIKTTNKAVQAKILTERQAIEVMDDVRNKMASMGHIVNQNGEVMSRADTAWQRWARGGVQNAGYQFADFAVQVQGGTSAMVAFGQQAPQLLGTFGAVGAVAGAVVAIMAAVANYFMLTSGEAKTLDDAMQRLEDSTRKYADSNKLIKDSDTALVFGNMTEEVQKLTRATLELDRAAALSNLSASIKKLVDETTKLGFFEKIGAMLIASKAPVTSTGAEEAATDLFRAGNFEDLGLNIGYDVFKGMMDGIIKSARGGDVQSVTLQLADMINQAMPDGILDEEGMLKPGAAMLIQYRELVLEAAKFAAELNGSADNAARAKDEASELARHVMKTLEDTRKTEESRAKDAAKASEMLSDMQEQTALQQAIATYGEDSLRVDELRAIQARAQYAEKVNALDVEESIKIAIMDAYDAMVSATSEASAFASEAARAKAEFDSIVGLISSIQGQIANLGITNIGKQARLAALQAGESEMSAAMAANIATERARLAPALGAGDAAIRAGAAAELERYIAGQKESLRIDEETSAVLKSRRDAEKAADGGGGGGGKADRDVLNDLVNRIKLERELLGVSEEERQVRVAVARADKNYTEQQIQGVIQVLEAERKIIEQRQEMERMADFIGSQMEDALMSIIDRTKSVEDAFKGMARAVIAELYRVIVVQQIVGSFAQGGGGLLGMAYKVFGSANGNVFMGGGAVPYAEGGVVSRPTYFPMSDGRTGLMGEAGPEAILPLKRGPGGKLGVAASGSGGTVVNNNITVSGSDAESVRREITKMIPQISRVTTAAVIDARKRGGAMKNTFG